MRMTTLNRAEQSNAIGGTSPSVALSGNLTHDRPGGHPILAPRQKDATIGRSSPSTPGVRCDNGRVFPVPVTKKAPLVRYQR
ncbi:hypothetical protein CEXT_459251 [Caerostris extrusa]|uniref:Uncharacterized protein n=1 Tax=Caerostris extrusa TaxID=172846 RepID=A0AAV4QAL4_CAEEX|nr:hypothetical protein CEXT_459251 [Caerostris extrusa]